MGGVMTSPLDARRLLGLDEDADARAVRAARRRLAKESHPDTGGSPEAMRLLNEAADVVLGDLAAGRASDGPTRPASRPPTGATMTPRRRIDGRRVDHDVASFTIEALPVDAFEALLVVTSWIGEVVVDEPPYQLEVLLLDPLRCWCRLDLVPDAGASTVAVTIAALADEPLPDIDAVRDLWVTALNDLGARPGTGA
jgi:hypothetical protein